MVLESQNQMNLVHQCLLNHWIHEVLSAELKGVVVKCTNDF